MRGCISWVGMSLRSQLGTIIMVVLRGKAWATLDCTCTSDWTSHLVRSQNVNSPPQARLHWAHCALWTFFPLVGGETRTYEAAVGRYQLHRRSSYTQARF